ncbi:hypothetical protein F7725_012324, partial [Dissostichus mawsoni]
AYPEYLITYQILKPEITAQSAAAAEQKSTHTYTHTHTHTHTHTQPVTYGLLPHLIVYKMASGYCDFFNFKAKLENTTKQCVVAVIRAIDGLHLLLKQLHLLLSVLDSLLDMCLNGEEETSDSLESIEVSSSEETSPADPQTSTDPLPLLPEDPANIALFVDVSPSADLLNVLPHVDASTTRSHPPPEFPHPFSTAAPTLKIPLSTALTGVPVCVTFQFYTPEPEPEPRGDSK